MLRNAYSRLVPEVENTSHLRFVPTVVDRVTCLIHRAEKGRGCWEINTVSDFRAPAICNARAISAGMNSPISETAFVVKSKSKPNRRNS